MEHISPFFFYYNGFQRTEANLDHFLYVSGVGKDVFAFQSHERKINVGQRPGPRSKGNPFQWKGLVT